MIDSKRIINVSSFLASSRQEINNQSKATTWFLAIFSAAEDWEETQINDDITSSNRA